MGATKTSAMIALILMGAAFLSLSMGFTGLPRAMAELIESYNITGGSNRSAYSVLFNSRHVYGWIVICCSHHGNC